MPEATLDSLAAEVDALEESFRALRREHGAESLETRPGPKSWSVAEVARHLVITWDRYRPPMQAHADKLRGADRISPSGEVRPGWLAGKFLGMVAPRNTKKLKAPGAFQPSQGEADVTDLDVLIERQSELRGMLAAAQGLELNRHKFASPITRLLRFTLGEGLVLMVRHEQRHLQQAQRAVARG